MDRNNSQYRLYLRNDVVANFEAIKMLGIPIKAFQLDLEQLSERQWQEIGILYANNYDLDNVSEALEHLKETGALISCDLVENLSPCYPMPVAS